MFYKLLLCFICKVSICKVTKEKFQWCEKAIKLLTEPDISAQNLYELCPYFTVTAHCCARAGTSVPYKYCSRVESKVGVVDGCPACLNVGEWNLCPVTHLQFKFLFLLLNYSYLNIIERRIEKIPHNHNVVSLIPAGDLCCKSYPCLSPPFPSNKGRNAICIYI